MSKRPLTDRQLEWIFQNRLSHHNAFSCNTIIRGEAGQGDVSCAGMTHIVNGRLKFVGTCGEPCSYLKRADDLQQSIRGVTQMARIIDEVREAVK